VNPPMKCDCFAAYIYPSDNAILLDVSGGGKRRRIGRYLLEVSAVTIYATSMKTATKPALGDTQIIHMLPRWVTTASGQGTDSVAFTSGAALAMLDVVLRDPGGTLPGTLLRDRMAVDAAVACLKLENRHETASDIRDAVCLARAGDALGPAGDMFVAWRKLAWVNLTASGWKGRVTKLLPDLDRKSVV